MERRLGLQLRLATIHVALAISVALTGLAGFSRAGWSQTVINTIEALQNISPSGSYVLGSDIDASATATWNSGSGFIPIGPHNGTHFTGTFDGQGHTISNLTSSAPINYSGLFSDVDSPGVIRNVGVINATIKTGMASGQGGGLLVGQNEGTVENLYATGKIDGGTYGSNVGGLVGSNLGLITQSYATVAVTGQSIYSLEVINNVTRVSGPFVVEAIIAPVQPIDHERETDAATHVDRMIEVFRQSKTLQLPGNRKLTLSAIHQNTDTEYLHAEAMESDNRVAVVFGPEDGAISSTMVYEAAREAHFLKFDRIYFFGFAIQAQAREMLETKQLRIPASYVAVTPDVAMADLLKTTRASEIFSITGLPDFDVRRAKKKGRDGATLHEVELLGLDIFNPETLETEAVDGQNVPCWMLDTDYDGMCFYATQVFFPKTSAWDSLQKSLKASFEDSVWDHLAGTVSEPFTLGERRRVSVKVIDERGNELLRVRDVEA